MKAQKRKIMTYKSRENERNDEKSYGKKGHNFSYKIFGFCMKCISFMIFHCTLEKLKLLYYNEEN